jgi:hypothetical protein
MDIVMFKMYLIYNEELTDTNVILTDKGDIEDKIKELADKSDTDISEWKYKEIMEGVPFKGNLNM